MAKKVLVNKEVPDDPYAAGWNGNLEIPTKNAIYDKIETLGAGSTTITANTGTSINLSNINGNLCNLRAADTANANTTFTTTAGVAGGWARVMINNGTSEPTVTGAEKQEGSDWVASTDMYLDIWSDGTDEYYNFVAIGLGTAEPNPTLSKSFTIKDPVATDDGTAFFTPVAITITDVRSHITGTTNVVFNIGHASTRTGTQLDVFTADITLTSTSGQSNSTGFNDATIPANSWVWLEVVSVSGTPTWFHATIIYTED